MRRLGAAQVQQGLRGGRWPSLPQRRVTDRSQGRWGPLAGQQAPGRVAPHMGSRPGDPDTLSQHCCREADSPMAWKSRSPTTHTLITLLQGQARSRTGPWRGAGPDSRRRSAPPRRVPPRVTSPGPQAPADGAGDGPQASRRGGLCTGLPAGPQRPRASSCFYKGSLWTPLPAGLT